MFRGNTTLTDVRTPESATTAVLGYAVFWRMSGVQVSHPDLVHLVQQAGFPSVTPAPPSQVTALRRALVTWAREQPVATLSLRSISHAPLVLALVEDRAGGPGLEITSTTALRVLYDPAQQDILCTRQPTGPIDAQSADPRATQGVRSRWQYHRQVHQGEDLSRLVRAIVASMDAVRLQRGVYFVHARYRSHLQRLDSFIDALPGPGMPLLVSLERLDQPRTRKLLTHAIHADVVGELTGMEERLTQALSASAQPSLTLVTQHLLAFRAFHAKAQVYADLLADRHDEITQRLSALHERVQSLLLFEAEEVLGHEHPSITTPP